MVVVDHQDQCHVSQKARPQVPASEHNPSCVICTMNVCGSLPLMLPVWRKKSRYILTITITSRDGGEVTERQSAEQAVTHT